MDQALSLDEQIAIIRSWGWASTVEFVDAHGGFWHEVFFPIVDGEVVRQAPSERQDNNVRVVLCTCPGGGGPDDLEHRPGCPLNPYPATTPTGEHHES